MSFQKSGSALKVALIALLVLIPLSACQTSAPRSQITQTPLVQCEERSPGEPAPSVDAYSEDWRYWYGKFLEALGMATSEIQKRATSANCLDDLRKRSVIR